MAAGWGQKKTPQKVKMTRIKSFGWKNTHYLTSKGGSGGRAQKKKKKKIECRDAEMNAKRAGGRKTEVRSP